MSERDEMILENRVVCVQVGRLLAQLTERLEGPIVARTRDVLAKKPVLSLFSGAGGLDTGFEEAGFDVPLAIDVAEPAIATYRRNHPRTEVIQADLLTLSDQAIIDLWVRVAGDMPPAGVIGGPPCQSFSVSNVHQKDDDPRSLLPGRYAAILRAVCSRLGLDFFLFENVPGLLGRRHRHRFESFLQECRDLGFNVEYRVLDAADFGLPQYRQRLVVLGVRSDLCPQGHPGFPVGRLRPQTVFEAIGSLPDPVVRRRGMKPADVPYHPNHWCLTPKSPRFRDGTLKPGVAAGRSFRVLEWHKPSWTVAYGNREVHVHPSTKRRLSVYEAMLLQGFPPTYVLEGSITQQFKLVSDAVPPPLARALAQHIASRLYSGG